MDDKEEAQAAEPAEADYGDDEEPVVDIAADEPEAMLEADSN
jgi:hypothetical protein